MAAAQQAVAKKIALEAAMIAHLVNTTKAVALTARETEAHANAEAEKAVMEALRGLHST